jgi:hypothetical protein
MIRKLSREVPVNPNEIADFRFWEQENYWFLMGFL